MLKLQVCEPLMPDWNVWNDWEDTSIIGENEEELLLFYRADRHGAGRIESLCKREKGFYLFKWRSEKHRDIHIERVRAVEVEVR